MTDEPEERDAKRRERGALDHEGNKGPDNSTSRLREHGIAPSEDRYVTRGVEESRGA